MQYRPEIDGLRALAVVPVIFFHAGFQVFGGGFVGVDVFFVISGYLITSILISDIESRQFSFINFYERRARRILPALFFVVLTCVPFAWFWMLPNQLKDFGQSMVSVAIFSSNVLFWIKSGYFAQASELKPLLHTWSLAVEEQYYLLFPLIFYAAWKYGISVIALIIVFLSAASFSIAELNLLKDTSANFYLILSRLWELGLGALTAMAHGRWQIAACVRETASLAGIGLIITSVFLLSNATPFPGVYALLPTAGTVLVILFCTKDQFVGKALSARLMVATGLISYSLYLWHQPLFAFARLRLVEHPDRSIFVALILLAFVLAAFSYRFIEKPFRDKERVSRRDVFATSVASTSVVVACGLILSVNSGFPGRMDQQTRDILSYERSFNQKTKECWEKLAGFKTGEEFCSYGSESGAARVGVIGDSHASTLMVPLAHELSEIGIQAIDYTYNSCLPLINGTYGEKGKTQQACDRFREWFFANLNLVPPTLIVLARWPLFIEQSRFDNQEGGIEPGSPVKWDLAGPGLYAEVLQQEYVTTIEALLNAGKQVVLVYPVPEVGWVVPQQLAKIRMHSGNQNASLTTSYGVYQERNLRAFQALNRIPDRPGLIRIKPHELFCNRWVVERCSVEKDGIPLYYDDDHLSIEGATLLVDHILLNTASIRE